MVFACTTWKFSEPSLGLVGSICDVCMSCYAIHQESQSPVPSFLKKWSILVASGFPRVTRSVETQLGLKEGYYENKGCLTITLPLLCR